jgi:thiamine pyrophosphokinase
MRVIIFANGVMNRWPDNVELTREAEMIIAADGGLKHCLNWKMTPHMIVGDMDSVDPSGLQSLETEGVEIRRYPSRKDDTDLALAIRAALERCPEEIVILGALGGRWDMTVANIMILASSGLKGISIRVVDENQELFVVHGGEECRLSAGKGDLLSLLPLTEIAEGVRLKGFEYPLENETLTMGTTRGISNIFKSGSGSIALTGGKLLITVTRFQG